MADAIYSSGGDGLLDAVASAIPPDFGNVVPQEAASSAKGVEGLVAVGSKSPTILMGLSVWTWIIILVVLAGLGYVGWRMYTKKQKKKQQ